MILEKETYEKFGYYPSDLTPQSKKLILAACDDCGKIRELYKFSYRALCRSCVRKGVRNPLFGKYHSEETKQKIRGENNPNWKGGKVKRICEGCGTVFEVKSYIVKGGDGKYCSKSCRRRHQKFPKHHTKPELIFEQICKKNNLPFKYTGDGSFWIGKKGKKQLNPDFIEANGKKICVEIMGKYWHSPLLNRNLRESALLPYREKHYKKYKWIPVFIWDTDLLRKDSEQFVLNELKDQGNM